LQLAANLLVLAMSPFALHGNTVHLNHGQHVSEPSNSLCRRHAGTYESEDLPMNSSPQANNPLHGVTLQAILEALVAHYGGFAPLAKQIPIRCFSHEPSIKSSLTFLRKTPWARQQVEALYIKLQPQLQK
jgi:hypothetical protein